MSGARRRSVTLDPWGFALNMVTATGDNWRRHHDAIASIIFSDAKRAGIEGSTEVTGLFTDLLPSGVGHALRRKRRDGLVPDARLRRDISDSGFVDHLHDVKAIHYCPTRYPLAAAARRRPHVASSAAMPHAAAPTLSPLSTRPPPVGLTRASTVRSPTQTDAPCSSASAATLHPRASALVHSLRHFQGHISSFATLRARLPCAIGARPEHRRPTPPSAPSTPSTGSDGGASLHSRERVYGLPASISSPAPCHVTRRPRHRPPASTQGTAPRSRAPRHTRSLAARHTGVVQEVASE